MMWATLTFSSPPTIQVMQGDAVWQALFDWPEPMPAVLRIAGRQFATVEKALIDWKPARVPGKLAGSSHMPLRRHQLAGG